MLPQSLSKRCVSGARSVLFPVLVLVVSVLIALPIVAMSPGEPQGPSVGPNLPGAALEPEGTQIESSTYGYVRPPLDLSHLAGNWNVGLQAAALASRFDWREQGKVTRVQNQQTCGGCYAFATLGSFESQLLIRGETTYDFSEHNALSCTYERANFGYNGCAGGNIWLVTNLYATKGSVLEACDPFTPSDTPCRTDCTYIKRVTDMWVLGAFPPPAPSVLKNWLQTYGPLYVGINAGQNDAWAQEFSGYRGGYTLYNPSQTSEDQLNHAVLLVGWDDSLQYTGGTGGWIVKNSWGTGWGGTCGYGSEGGYFTIAYGSAGIGSDAAFVQNWQSYDPNSTLLYNDRWGNKVGYGWEASTSAWGLARLVPNQAGCASQVEIWTTDETTDVDIYIYDTFNGGATSGLLWSRENLAFAYAGYHTIRIEPPLPLTSGNDVAVKVKFGNKTSWDAVPMDWYRSGTSVAPVSNQSFVSSSGADGTWLDLGAGSAGVTPRDVGIRLRMAPCAAQPTSTPTLTRTATGTPTRTNTPTRTVTPGPSPTPTRTFTPGPGRSYLPLVLKPAPPTPTPTWTVTRTPTRTFTPTRTATPAATNTATPQTGGWVTIVSESFEGSFPGPWRLNDQGSSGMDYYWAKRNCLPYAGSFSGWAVGGGSGGNALACGANYPDNVNGWMIYGPFSLVGATAADLSFKLWIQAERDIDVVWRFASINGTDFYGSGTTGTSGGWVDVSLNLANVYMLGNLLGRPQVWVALVFESDFSINYPVGAYVDNILLRKYVGAAAPAYAPGDAASPDGGPGGLTELLTERPIVLGEPERAR